MCINETLIGEIMEQLFMQAEILAKDTQDLKMELFKYNPSFRKETKVMPLPVLAQSIATIMKDFSRLWVNINERCRDA